MFELNFGRKKLSLQCYIEVLPLVIPLLSSTYYFQSLQIYFSNTKIHTRPFLLVILMATHSCNGPMTTTSEGREIKNLISSLNLSQLISEPTYFERQPNPVLDCGTRTSLDSFCHHEITYCKVNFNIPPLAFERKLMTGLTYLS